MAFSIEITPSRGLVTLGPAISQTTVILPTSFGGIKVPSNVGSTLFLSTAYYKDNKITFNNADLSLVTEVVITDDGYPSNSIQIGRTMMIYNYSDPYKFVIYKITGVTETPENFPSVPDRYVTFDVEYYNGSVTSIGSSILAVHDPVAINNPLGPAKWVGTPDEPVIVNGSREAMNAFLQGAGTTMRWEERPAGITNFGSGTVAAKGTLSYTGTPTTDVVLTYVVKEDGVARTPYQVKLAYRSPSQVQNFNGYPT